MLADSLRATLTRYHVMAYASIFDVEDKRIAVVDIRMPSLLLRSTLIYPDDSGASAAAVLDDLMANPWEYEVRRAARVQKNHAR